MSAVTTLPQPADPAPAILLPRNIDEALRLAKIMASAKLVPEHLQGDVPSCFMVVEQAMRWRMSPFAVAQCCSSIRGRLMYEGKLVAAAVESTGAIIGGFDYAYAGEGEALKVTATATRAVDKTRRSITVELRRVRTDNKAWKDQPEQQLCYSASRIWARRWTPSALLGVYAPEEWDAQGTNAQDDLTGPLIDGAVDNVNDAPRAAAVRVREDVRRSEPPPQPGETTSWQSMLDAARDGGTWFKLYASLLRNAPDVDAVVAITSHPSRNYWHISAKEQAQRDIEDLEADAMSRVQGDGNAYANAMTRNAP